MSLFSTLFTSRFITIIVDFMEPFFACLYRPFFLNTVCTIGTTAESKLWGYLHAIDVYYVQNGFFAVAPFIYFYSYATAYYITMHYSCYSSLLRCPVSCSYPAWITLPGSVSNEYNQRGAPSHGCTAQSRASPPFTICLSDIKGVCVSATSLTRLLPGPFVQVFGCFVYCYVNCLSVTH